MLANTIIDAVLRRLLVVASGDTPSAQLRSDGLELINDMITSWSAEHTLVYEDTLESLTIPVSTQSFTIGATGDQVTARPLRIVTATLKDGDIEYPLNVHNAKGYQDVIDKTIVDRPETLYYRNTYPDGTMYFNVTTDKAYTLILTSMKELAQFTDGTTDNPLPPYYEKALKDNLTVEWAPELGAANRVTSMMVQKAEESKKRIVGQSLDFSVSRIDFQNGRVYVDGDYNRS